MTELIIINGPNLNKLGQREPDIYGTTSFEDFLKKLEEDFPDLKLDYFQSNVEGEIIDKLQESDGKYSGIILNAGGYTHTSVAIADAVKSLNTSVVEVHISNIFAREKFRHKSLIASACKGTITGFGLDSYKLAIFSFC